MAKRITEYTNIETIAESDVLPIVDVSDTEQATTGSTRKGTVGKIADYIKDRAETLTNKILTTARLNTPKINEDVTVTATSTELNKLDGMAGDAVGTTDTQTLTNKTLTAPALSSPTISGAWDGWISAGETWTYASATTITVPSGAASKYQKGDKIKITNNSATKYFYIVGVADTVLTVTGGSDYTVHNSAITNPFFSKIENPQGFPGVFNWSPSYGGGSLMTYTSVTTEYAQFKILGNLCWVYVRTSAGTTGGTASAYLTVSLPVTPLATAGSGIEVEDSGIVGGYCQIASAYGIAVFKYDFSNYGLGTNRRFRIVATYLI